MDAMKNGLKLEITGISTLKLKGFTSRTFKIRIFNLISFAPPDPGQADLSAVSWHVRFANSKTNFNYEIPSFCTNPQTNQLYKPGAVGRGWAGDSFGALGPATRINRLHMKCAEGSQL